MTDIPGHYATVAYVEMIGQAAFDHEFDKRMKIIKALVDFAEVGLYIRDLEDAAVKAATLAEKMVMNLQAAIRNAKAFGLEFPGS